MRYLVKLVLLLLPLSLGAQTVTITGTVQDITGAPYQNGTVRAVLVSGNGSGQQAWTYGGTNPVSSTQCVGGLDGFGKFTCHVTNTSLIDQQTSLPQWQFQFNSFDYQVGGIRSCIVPSLSLSSNQDITTYITAIPCPSLPSATGNLSSPPPIGNVTPNTGAFTSLTSTSGTLNGTIGATTPSIGSFTTLNSTSGTLNGTIGFVTPNMGTFTSLTSTSGALNGTIGLATPNTGAFTGLTASSSAKFSFINGATQCLHADAIGLITGTGVDCGAPGGGNFSGPGSSTTNDLVSFNDTTGKIGKDSGILSTNVVTGAVNFASANFLIGSGSGRQITDSGISSANPSFSGTLTAPNLNGAIGNITPNPGHFTTLSSTSGALNGTIGATTPSTVAATTIVGNINGVINPKASPYNASGTYSVDDTSALQSAINAAANGVLKIPIGVYKLSSALSLSSANHITIICDGYPFSNGGVNQTILIQTTLNTPVIDAGTATEFSIKGCALAHGTYTGTFPSGSIVYGVATPGGDGLKACISQSCGSPQLDHLWAESSYVGFNLGPTTLGNFSNSLASNNHSDGVLLAGQSFGNGLQWGIQVVTSELNDGWGFNVSLNASASFGGTLSPWVQPYTFANTLGGILLQGRSGHGLSDISIMNCYGSTDGNDQIRIDSYATSITVVGCMLENAGKGPTGSGYNTPVSGVGNGINVTANNEAIVLTGNTIQSMATNAITDAGKGTVVTGNRLNNSSSGYVNATGAGSGGANSVVTGNVISNSSQYGAFMTIPDVTCLSGNSYYNNTIANFAGTAGICQDTSLSTVVTVANLQSCSAILKGAIRTVTDCNTGCTTWGGTFTGAGGTTILAACNGTNWTVLGK